MLNVSYNRHTSCFSIGINQTGQAACLDAAACYNMLLRYGATPDEAGFSMARATKTAPYKVDVCDVFGAQPSQ